MNKITASIVGASGYAGGELLRLLLFHPQVEVKQVTSERYFGKFVHKVHPNLRGQTTLKFCSMEDLQPCDVLFLCLPHGEAQKRIDQFLLLAKRIIDLSADFRLQDAEVYRLWYGHDHLKPELLPEFVYGIPELHREEMEKAHLISSAGCNATATILALCPLFKEGLVEQERTVVEVKVGSSEAGNKANEGSHHPIRHGCVRSFKATGHRHQAEIVQELSFQGPINVHFSATAIEMVRGVLATCHVFLKQEVTEKDIWKVYRKYFASEPFLRIVKERDGVYRYPEPKLLAGTNFCDVGFELDASAKRLVVISAIDNLMKGAAGQALQAMNIMLGFPEPMGLEFPGLHPI
ncbi:MAG TPA: N-acetyl-gamma-glutamyl-phosphate reductase [Caldithrix abyssi]|uniref:N-acetyl-gamma-glutamyl-phosphate reductase n=1 Tax=Caldithrix abyssi TaxID=187145 RepID=A0A7V5LIJ2_CALAY|nr:N-acetyl-gamma-glutamyl-phosphate reductase [Caldithrix abyssi]